MPSTDSLVVKSYLTTPNNQEPEIHRFIIDGEVAGSFTYLKEKVRNTYPQLLRENFSIVYVDEEGDKITISSDDELAAALMSSKRKEGEPFRIYVQLGNGPKVIPITSANFGNCSGDLHTWVTCDECNGSVRGFRYKCLQCPDFDLCGKCESSGLHPGHIMIRVSGPLPQCMPMLSHIVNTKGVGRCGRRRGGGRPSFHGHWNAWCPSGENVEVDTEDKKSEEKKCPLNAHVEKAKQTAKVLQETAGSEFLQSLGNTISSILEQFGIDTQVDVHTPGQTPPCSKQQTTEETKTEPPKEYIIPIQVENSNPPSQPEKTAEVKSPEPSKTPEHSVSNNNPYASVAVQVAEAVAAAQAVEKAMEQMAIAGHIAEVAAAASGQTTPRKSPSSESWNFVNEEGNVTAVVSDSELGARPKAPTPPPVLPRTPINEPVHPDPKIANALQTMLAMGFTNEGGWLAQLLEVKEGDIGKVLDVLHPVRRC